MKRHIFLVIIALAALTAPAGAAEGEEQVATGWSLYSCGLYYKYLARECKESDKADTYLLRAVDFFNKALEKGQWPDRVHYQIADCYYRQKNHGLALAYSKKSIAANAANPLPYHLVFRIMLEQKDDQKAAAILEDYCSARPKSIYLRYELAKHYYNRLHDLAKAEKHFREILRLAAYRPVQNYYRANTCSYLGYIYYHEGKMKKALRFFRRADRIEGNNREAMYFIARLSMFLDDIDTAEDYASRYLGGEPDEGSEAMHSLLGRIYYLKGDPRAVYHLGMGKGSATLEGLADAALYHERLGHDDTALGLLEGALQFFPEEVPLHVALARIAERKNMTEDAFKQYFTAGVFLYKRRLYQLAETYLAKAGAIKKDVPEVHYYSAKAYEDSGDYYSAIRHYRRLNELLPNNGVVLHVGYLYGVKKEYATAMTWFNKAAADDPSSSQPHFFRGLVSLWREKYGDAEKYLKKSIAMDDGDESCYFYLAMTMEKTGRLDKAIEYLKQAIKIDGKSARSLNYLGYLYADNNMKLDQSQELIEKALAIEPHNGAYVDSLGWLHFRKGNFKLALAHLLHAERLLGRGKSPDPVVYDHIGDTYHRMGMFRKAIRYWSKSVKLEGNEAIERKILQLQKQMKKENNS